MDKDIEVIENENSTEFNANGYCICLDRIVDSECDDYRDYFYTIKLDDNQELTITECEMQGLAKILKAVQEYNSKEKV